MAEINLHNVKVFNSTDAFNYAAAEFIVSLFYKAMEARGRFTICLSGGETPMAIYELLAELPFREQICWKKTHVFWGDERCVPLDDEKNNAYQAKKNLLNKVNIPESNIHSIPVNLKPKEAATSYEKELHTFFGDETPQFDLILLGLGANGHTASLFPHTNVLSEKKATIKSLYVEEEKMYRITMTAPLINNARQILFLVSGENKTEILKTVLTGDHNPDLYPAQLIKPTHGELCWFADKEANSLITE